jgi:cytochrome o ubiquinol oxidase subunit II
MLIVVIPVLLLTLFFSWRYREKRPRGKYDPNWSDSLIAECFWWGVPCIIIAILAVLTWKATHELDPFRPLESDKKPLVIQVIALDWKWLFLYPEQGVATINEIQFPEKTPLHFEITSDAPMNAFWIPQLGGQIYAMPAMRAQLNLIANEKGVFRGCSGNISGEGFAGMVFLAKSTSQEDFDRWIASIQSSAPPLDILEYQKLLKPSQYDPVSFYQLKKKDLFDYVMDKYMSPSP